MGEFENKAKRKRILANYGNIINRSSETRKRQAKYTVVKSRAPCLFFNGEYQMDTCSSQRASTVPFSTPFQIKNLNDVIFNVANLYSRCILYI